VRGRADKASGDNAAGSVRPQPSAARGRARTTRRVALAAAAGATVATLARPQPAAARPVAGAPRPEQIAIARTLLAVERELAALYADPPPRVPVAAAAFARIEAAHVRRLERLLARLGAGDAARETRGAESGAAARMRAAGAVSAQGAPGAALAPVERWLELATALERRSLALYQRLVAALDDDAYLAPVAAAALADAQQLTLLAAARGVEVTEPLPLP